MTADERWRSLSQAEQDAENAERVERGQRPIPTRRHRQVHVSPPIMLSLGGKEHGIAAMGMCLCCGHLMPLAVWKDDPLGRVTHGVCAPCRDAALHLRGDCSTERGCWCEKMGETAARRERELRDEEKRARVALAREEARGGS